MTAVGFEPTPFRNGALSHRLRPLGQTVMFAIGSSVSATFSFAFASARFTVAPACKAPPQSRGRFARWLRLCLAPRRWVLGPLARHPTCCRERPGNPILCCLTCPLTSSGNSPVGRQISAKACPLSASAPNVENGCASVLRWLAAFPFQSYSSIHRRLGANELSRFSTFLGAPAACLSFGLSAFWAEFFPSSLLSLSQIFP